MPPDLVQAEEVEQTLIVDSSTGRVTLAGQKGMTISVDPMTGAKRRVTTLTKIRSNDGRIVDPNEQVYACCGRPLLTSHSVVFCCRCQKPVCRLCARGKGEQQRCRHCWWITLPSRSLSWLLNVS